MPPIDVPRNRARGYVQLGKEADDVAGIDFGMIIGRLGIAVGLAAAAHVHGDDPPAGGGDRRRQILEIARVAGEAMQAEDGEAMLPVSAGIVAAQIATGRRASSSAARQSGHGSPLAVA